MEVTARVEVHYCTPPGSVVGDVLRLLRTRTWAAFMTRHVAPRLEKVSPADSSVLEALDRRWKVAANEGHNPIDCVICMESDGEDDDSSNAGEDRPRNNGVQLPCGHIFHHRCVYSWLELQSTCPICRAQFPKAFTGRYAVRRVNSTIVLPEDLSAWPRDQVASAPVEGRAVRTVVQVTLEKVNVAHVKPLHAQRLCEVNALLMDVISGETFLDMESRGPARSSPINPARLPVGRVAATRFANACSHSAMFSDAASAREADRKRHYCGSCEGGEEVKRQRTSECTNS
ncbi:hypothetical protein BBJ28_00009973 [Nothophytophthora sp. Chile5]|nr:hypothetical protein BBJ28_00009973 [Nothophytophthora sp. Chile5]